MTRAYYVVFEGDRWKVKLERGAVISTHRKQKRAKQEARRLASQPGTKGDKVVVNARAGYTRYHIDDP